MTHGKHKANNTRQARDREIKREKKESQSNKQQKKKYIASKKDPPTHPSFFSLVEIKKTTIMDRGKPLKMLFSLAFRVPK